MSVILSCYICGDLLCSNRKRIRGLPWWRCGWESACQCRGRGFEPWSRRIPHAAEQLRRGHHNFWARMAGARALQRGRPPRWGACAPRWGVAPARRSRAEPTCSNEDPTQPKRKKIKNNKKKRKRIREGTNQNVQTVQTVFQGVLISSDCYTSYYRLSNSKFIVCLWVYFCFVNKFICIISIDSTNKQYHIKKSYYRLDALNNKHLFLMVLKAGCLSKIKVLADPLSDKDLSPGLQTTIFWLCPHMAESRKRGSKLSHVSYKDTNPIHEGSILMT